MFCHKCGKENKNDSLFCIYCGTKLQMNSSEVNANIKADEQTDLQIAEEYRDLDQPIIVMPVKKPKKRLKIALIVGLVILILLGAGIGAGFYQTGDEAYVKAFARALIERRWKDAYDFFQFLRADSDEYETWAADEFSTVQSYHLEELEMESGTQKDNNKTGQKQYRLILLDKDNKEIFSDVFIVRRQEEKRFLIFPTWKLEEPDLLAEDIDIVMPEGAAFAFDGADVPQNQLTANGDGTVTYHVDYLFSGTYTVKLTKQYYMDVEQQIQITPETMEAGPVVLALEMNPDFVWRKAYYDFIVAVADSNMDIINASFPESAEAAQAFLDASVSVREMHPEAVTHFSLVYLDDNDMPEIMLSIGEDTLERTGMLFAIREQRVVPIMFPETEFGSPYLIPGAFDTYLKERQGLIVSDNYAIEVGGNNNMDAYSYDGTNMVLSKSIACNVAQLLVEQGNEEALTYCSPEKMKSTIDGKEVTAKKANKQIEKLKKDASNIFETVLDITPENLANALGFSY